MENLVINGIEYAPVVKVTGKRAVIVVDRGWIFAGDVTDKNGRIYLTNAVWVFGWESIGFAGVIKNPDEADIRKMDDTDIPYHSEIFRVPVCDGWGL